MRVVSVKSLMLIMSNRLDINLACASAMMTKAELVFRTDVAHAQLCGFHPFKRLTT